MRGHGRGLTPGPPLLCPPPVLWQAVRSLVDYCAPVIIALSPSQQETARGAPEQRHEDHAGGSERSSACVMQSETRLVPPATRVQCIMACRVARVFRRDVEGVAQRKNPAGHDAGHRVPARQHVAHQHSLANPQPHFTRGSPGRGGGPMSPPPPTMPAPVGAPAAEFTARSCLPVKPCANPPGAGGSTR
ncbi:hypothetical protein GWK47_016299 [Chionoecetes opilio]|uniref:Uncharacterized protein n=1 Tax=Chionoecetes opilio TaxID=41210 RepID=A0A8J5CKA6_CHIOP|nr:hypothetical protein GWK47_016299 [Chionoecetes opilio]